MRFDHRQIIRREEGYQDFTDPGVQWSLLRWLYARSWYSVESPLGLFDLATARLVERRVLLPGVTLLERMVARVYDQAAERLWARMVKRLTAEQSRKLLELLEPDAGSPSFTRLELLRRPPVRQSGPGLIEALDRLEQLRGLGVGAVDFSLLPYPRLKVMAQYAASAVRDTIAYQQAMAGVAERLATLFAFAHTYETRALDDALDLLEVLLSQTFAAAFREGEQNRLRTLKELDAAALQLAAACQVVLDLQIADPEVRREALKRVTRNALQQAVETVRTLARPASDQHQQEMVEHYRQIRLYLPTVLQTIDFQATTGGKEVKDALEFVKGTFGQAKADFSGAPLPGITKAWRDQMIGKNGKVSREASTVWIASRLREAIGRHDLYVVGSERWGDVQGKLLHGDAWNQVKAEMSRALGRSLSGVAEVEQLGRQLDAAYRTTLAHLPNNPAVDLRRLVKITCLISYSVHWKLRSSGRMSAAAWYRQMPGHCRKIPQLILTSRLSSGAWLSVALIGLGTPAPVSDCWPRACDGEGSEMMALGLAERQLLTCTAGYLHPSQGVSPRLRRFLITAAACRQLETN
jgi:hypothetical protein